MESQQIIVSVKHILGPLAASCFEFIFVCSCGHRKYDSSCVASFGRSFAHFWKQLPFIEDFSIFRFTLQTVSALIDQLNISVSRYVIGCFDCVKIAFYVCLSEPKHNLGALIDNTFGFNFWAESRKSEGRSVWNVLISFENACFSGTHRIGKKIVKKRVLIGGHYWLPLPYWFPAKWIFAGSQ